MIEYDYDSPIGVLRFSLENGNLIGVSFREKKEKNEDFTEFLPIITWFEAYFSGKRPENLPKLTMSGTSFQRDVYEILLTIPYGKSMTYGEIAGELARRYGIKRMSSQAVGQAVSKNPIAILVPCHRVLGQKRKITGYAGGLDKKRYLLELEEIEYVE